MSTAGQRENKLKEVNIDAYTAWRWYQDHKDEFQMEIFGPTILNCSVTDMSVVDAIENLINGTAFTCQNTDDYNKFMSKALGNADQGGLGLVNVTIKDFSRSRNPTLDSWTGRTSKDQVGLAAEGYDALLMCEGYCIGLWRLRYRLC